MGFIMILLLSYLALIIIDVFALKKKKRILFAAITATMILSIIILGYLWITSPM